PLPEYAGPVPGAPPPTPVTAAIVAPASVAPVSAGSPTSAAVEPKTHQRTRRPVPPGANPCGIAAPAPGRPRSPGPSALARPAVAAPAPAPFPRTASNPAAP